MGKCGKLNGSNRSHIYAHNGWSNKNKRIPTFAENDPQGRRSIVASVSIVHKETKIKKISPFPWRHWRQSLNYVFQLVIRSWIIFQKPSKRYLQGMPKVLPTTGNWGPEGEKRYSPTLSWPRSLGGVGGQHHGQPLYPRERPGTHCTGGWVGPRAGLDGCGKSRPLRDSIPGPSSP